MKKTFNKIIITILTLCVTLYSLCACEISIGGKPKEFLVFTLTEQEVESFNQSLETGKQKLPTALTAIEANAYLPSIINGFTYIAEQRYIAQILYFSDLENTEYEDNYNFATTAFTKAREGYISLFKTVYNSDSPLKAQIFAGMTEEEINLMFNAPSKVTELESENTKLLDEYYALSDEEFNEQTGLLYADMVTNYSQIATLSGFDNYYEYASSFVYDRDYDASSLANLTNYVKTYIIPLYTDLFNEFQSKYSALTATEKQTVAKIMSSPYNELGENYVFDYIESLPTSAKDSMNHMFKNKNYIIANDSNAREGAFTALMPYSKKPFCYFGSGYSDAFTILHEVGHYYAILNNIDTDIPLDIDEINSQANELMFLGYLEGELDSQIFEALELYSLVDMLSTIIISTMMNEFELKIFTSNDDVSNFTSQDFDAVMNMVTEEFGSNFVQTYITSNINGYWKRAIVQQPIYYVSYAVSALSALGLYSEAVISDDGYNNALSKYIDLCENADVSLGLLQVLEDTEMLSPFEENTYISLVTAFSN